MSRAPVRRALISVYDKTDLVPFVGKLAAAGAEIVSSGGTARVLEEAGLVVTRVADVTGSPEILGGRVKTLHPKIHGGILADPSDAEHRADLEHHGVEAFQLVVVNLYPFEASVALDDVTDRQAIENIDIGGPAMIRAAAKNHAHVGVVTSPAQYAEVVAAVEKGGLDGEMRRELARAAFYRTAAYDAAILRWLEPDELPARLVLALERRRVLRYGENPHQTAAAYREAGEDGWWTSAAQLQGKEMSFNNYVDTEAAWRLVWEFEDPAAVVVKHTNASGVAVADSLLEAFGAAWECDPLSAFGSVVSLNRPLDGPTAEAIGEVFVEVVIAPEVTQAAVDTLAGKKNLRVLVAPAPHPGGIDLRRLDGGFVAQTRDGITEGPDDWRVMTSRPPTPDEWSDLELAWVVAAHTKSNAVVIARDGAAVGVGAGDQSRVGAAERAVARAGERAVGAVAASDAFFPFRDGLDLLAGAGVKAVIEPGGSIRDEEVIVAAEQAGIALVFTGRRHFRH
ncbi:MAG: bifunctional phosphoribosylaminoimidazolecarboxamide formyltransferase/IMP cyclohydrolase [Acidimicrobiia bacterium]